MVADGWRLENEKPPRIRCGLSGVPLQALTDVDGTQVWRNLRIG